MPVAESLQDVSGGGGPVRAERATRRCEESFFFFIFFFIFLFIYFFYIFLFFLNTSHDSFGWMKGDNCPRKKGRSHAISSGADQRWAVYYKIPPQDWERRLRRFAGRLLRKRGAGTVAYFALDGGRCPRPRGVPSRHEIMCLALVLALSLS